MIVATGHPSGGRALSLPIGQGTGLLLLSTGIAQELQRRGVALVRPAEGDVWDEEGEGVRVAYVDGVAILTDGSNGTHTHSGEPMRRMLLEECPDLVLADHGF